MAARRVAAILALALVAACCTTTVVPTTVPTMPTVATAWTASLQGRAMTFTVAPWPLDESVAFLCRQRPGPEFTPDAPIPAAAAGCVRLEVSTTSDALVARLEAESLAPEVVGELARSGPPWFLAVAGRRGPFATATVLDVIDSPIPSDPGPS